jgi:glycosyltransferase involved in cell wall biosynthesis
MSLSTAARRQPSPAGIVRLGIVYHMPFWRGADGTLREVEGSFARYVDSLAPHFDEISLCVPVLSAPRGEGTPIRASNVSLAALPPFDGPVQFYPKLLQILPRLGRWVHGVDVLHCRVPTPAAVFAFAFARVFRRPTFLLVVGDLRALLPSMPYHGVKRRLWRAYTEFEEMAMRWMAGSSLTFANGEALARKYDRGRSAAIETRTSTIAAADIASRTDTCQAKNVRLLCVSRIDPRKGLRVLPAAVRALVDRGFDVTLDIIGPPVGSPGREEQRALLAESSTLGVDSRVRCLPAMALDALLPTYRAYDVFVLPTLPGEGIPRVLLEAMAGGLPVVTTAVAGIPSLITNEVNGLLVETSSGAAVADAVARLIADGEVRRRLIRGGAATASRHTLEHQAEIIVTRLHSFLDRPRAAAPAA